MTIPSTVYTRQLLHEVTHEVTQHASLLGHSDYSGLYRVTISSRLRLGTCFPWHTRLYPDTRRGRHGVSRINLPGVSRGILLWFHLRMYDYGSSTLSQGRRIQARQSLQAFTTHQLHGFLLFDTLTCMRDGNLITRRTLYTRHR